MLEGLHHITAITGDAPRNVDFYVRVLGLRMVKKTVNFDAPDVYHLYFGDEAGTPGSILTFFEFPGAARGRHGDGHGPHDPVARRERRRHRVLGRSACAARASQTERGEGCLRFDDSEGLRARARRGRRCPTRRCARSLAGDPAPSTRCSASTACAPTRRAATGARPSCEALGFTAQETDGVWTARGDSRHAVIRYEAPPAEHGLQGAGSIHHIAWNVADDAELEEYRAHAVARPARRPTQIIDRQYFHSVYFREPSGILFELASRDIGFDADEPLESLGEELKLPPQHEHLRSELERRLTPLTNPRTGAAA